MKASKAKRNVRESSANGYDPKKGTFKVYPPNVAYPEDLKTPIYVPVFAHRAMTPVRVKIALELSHKDIDKKFAALLAFYEIDPADEDAGLKLAIALASAHVPGMKLAFRRPPHKGHGPEPRADHTNDARLHYVDEFKKSRNLKHDIVAIRGLIAEKHPLFTSSPEVSIAARIKDARQRARSRAASSTK